MTKEQLVWTATIKTIFIKRYKENRYIKDAVYAELAQEERESIKEEARTIILHRRLV